MRWLSLAAVVATWEAADLAYSYYDRVLGREVPFPGIADILYYAGYLSFMAAVAFLALPERKLQDRRWLLDAAILMTVVGTLSWVYIIGPTASAQGSGFFDAAVALGYPLVDLALLGAVVVALYSAGSRFTRLALALGAAAAVQVFSDSVYAYAVIATGYENIANPVELGWLGAYVLLALCFVLPDERRPIAASPRRSTVGIVLPYAPVLPMAALTVASLGWGGPPAGLLVGTVAAGLLVMWRQILTLGDRTVLYEELEQTVMLLALAAEAHDETTGRHLRGVRSLTEALAQEMGYTQKEASDLALAAVLHDVGKFSVPDSLLAYPGPLDDAGREVMKRHATWGADFLAGRPGLELSHTVALYHHERRDGSGYPGGLAGEAIPEAATVVSVADSFDAMITDRPYRRRLSLESAVEEVRRCSGTQFSPRVVDAFLRLWRRGALPVPAEEREARKAA